jgi:hypothetical protein
MPARIHGRPRVELKVPAADGIRRERGDPLSGSLDVAG